MLDRLFKRTATGAIQVWSIELEECTGRYRTVSGKLDGKMVTSEWTVPKPKNAGRSNATTMVEQGALEMRAAWEKKQRDGYSLTPDDAHGSETFQCMLAQSYSDPKRKAEVLKAAERKYLFTQPKLDGVRCIASASGLLSRKNRPITAVPHISIALEQVLAENPGLVLDGELYNHDLREDFNQIVSMVRKSKPNAEELAQSAAMAQYWIYDCISPALKDATYDARIAMIDVVVSKVNEPSVRMVPSGVARDEQEIDAWYTEYLSQGYEGQMLRINGPYQNKRSALLLKRKEFEDTEFDVVDVKEGEGNRSGQAGYAIVCDKKGKQFKASIKGDLDQRFDLLNNRSKYIGGEVTVRFNGRTPDGIPRFPRAVAWYPGGRDA
jgi:DNA ligase-1